MNKSLTHYITQRNEEADAYHSILCLAFAFLTFVVLIMSLATEDDTSYEKFYQTDKKYRGMMFVAGETVAQSACGVCCLATITSKFGYYTTLEDTIQLYKDIMSAETQQHAGTSTAFVKKYCDYWGFKCSRYSCLTIHQIKDTVDNGGVVLLLLPANIKYLTGNSKHYVFIDGYYYEDDKIVFQLFNPETSKKVNKLRCSYDVVEQCSKMWIINK